MERTGCGQAAQIPRKGKKKKAKDEQDRAKQAEKKKRRLEKALATSAAIRSELEKKKQKKIEEQQRLDEEGAAIAESVALHVLLGEDTDEYSPFTMNNGRRSSNLGLFMGYRNIGKYSAAHESDRNWTDWGRGEASGTKLQILQARSLRTSYYEDICQDADISAGLVAAQAVSSLQIAEGSHEYSCTGQGAGAIFFNRIQPL